MQANFESLEQRQLLTVTPVQAYSAGAQSVAIGSTLFFASNNTDQGNGVGQLWKSDLDGGNPVLLHSYNTSEPTQLTAFHGKLYFAADDIEQAFTGGQEPWISDGTVQGTVKITDIYGGATGSQPYDFTIVHDQLYFLAQPPTQYVQMYTTDGTRDGTKAVAGQDSSRILNLMVKDDTLYFERAGLLNDQAARIAVGENPDPAIGIISSGDLRIFGSANSDTINLTSSNGTTSLTINGKVQSFNNDDFSTITIFGLAGNDKIQLDDSIQQNATIDGGDGNDTLDYSHITQSITSSGLYGDVLTIGSQTVTYSDVETLLAGSGDDTINIFDNNSNTTRPVYIDGGAGNDNLSIFEVFSKVSPTIHGGDGNDTLSVDIQGSELGPTSGGHTYYFGDAGDDTFIMNRSIANRDFNGGAGIDQVDYRNFTTAG